MGSVAMSCMMNVFLIYKEMRKYLTIYEDAISHSYMTLQPIPSEFPYIWGKFSFLFYPCSRLVYFGRKKRKACQNFPVLAMKKPTRYITCDLWETFESKNLANCWYTFKPGCWARHKTWSRIHERTVFEVLGHNLGIFYIIGKGIRFSFRFSSFLLYTNAL